MKLFRLFKTKGNRTALYLVFVLAGTCYSAKVSQGVQSDLSSGDFGWTGDVLQQLSPRSLSVVENSAVQNEVGNALRKVKKQTAIPEGEDEEEEGFRTTTILQPHQTQTIIDMVKQLDFNLETEEEAGDQFIEAFQEFYKLFDDYGIIEKAEFKNINKAYNNILSLKKNTEKENSTQTGKLFPSSTDAVLNVFLYSANNLVKFSDKSGFPAGHLPSPKATIRVANYTRETEPSKDTQQATLNHGEMFMLQSNWKTQTLVIQVEDTEKGKPFGSVSIPLSELQGKDKVQELMPLNPSVPSITLSASLRFPGNLSIPLETSISTMDKELSVLNMTISELEPCYTIQGHKCIFPLIYLGKTINRCSRSSGFFPLIWCATKVKNNGEYESWDYCDPKRCSEVQYNVVKE